MTALVHKPPHDASLGVLHNSGACLSNAGGKVLHLNDKSRYDDSNAFPVLLSVSVKGEAGATAAQQFDGSNSVDVNIRAGDGLDRTACQFQSTHCSPRDENEGIVCDFGTVEKNAALSFYRLNKNKRAFYRNLKTSESTSFPFSIRGRAPQRKALPAAIVRSVRTPGTPHTSFTESRGGVEGHARYALPTPEALGCLTGRNGKLAPNAKSVAGFESGPRDTLSCDASSRRNLAGNVIVIACHLYSSASLNGGCFYENPSRTDSDQLPGVFCRVRFQSPHGEQQTMRNYPDAANH